MENYHEIDFKAVGARIKNARRKLKFTQEKVAENAFITSQFLSRLENGHESAKIGTYRQIASVLGLTLDDLFYENAELMRIHKNSSFDGFMADCTPSERAMLADLMVAVKKVLIRARKF
jgi:transcriptional regulator with XRE-family HTH domain